MTAVCHGCTAIDEVLLSWTYIHHSSDSLHEVIHSLTSFRHGRKSFTIRIKLRFADYLRNDQSERAAKGRPPASQSTAQEPAAQPQAGVKDALDELLAFGAQFDNIKIQ